MALLCTLGDTKYYARMVAEAQKQFPDSLFIAVGFSMGGNIVARYLGEEISRQKSIVCGISLCQGYHGIRYMMLLCDYLQYESFTVVDMGESLMYDTLNYLFRSLGSSGIC